VADLSIMSLIFDLATKTISSDNAVVALKGIEFAKPHLENLALNGSKRQLDPNTSWLPSSSREHHDFYREVRFALRSLQGDWDLAMQDGMLDGEPCSFILMSFKEEIVPTIKSPLIDLGMGEDLLPDVVKDVPFINRLIVKAIQSDPRSLINSLKLEGQASFDEIDSFYESLGSLDRIENSKMHYWYGERVFAVMVYRNKTQPSLQSFTPDLDQVT